MNFEQLHKKLNEIGDAATGRFDDLQKRLEMIEALADRPKGTADTDELTHTIFESPEFQNVLAKRSNQAGIEIKVAPLMKKSILTDDIGVTGRDPNLYGAIRRSRPWVHEQVNQLPTSASTIEFARETSGSTVTAGIQYGGSPLAYDGSAKTEAALAMELIEARTLTFNIYCKASRQALSDISSLRQFLSNRLTYAVKAKLESEVVGGTGAAGRFSGLTKSGNFTAYSEESPQISSQLDKIRDAIAQLENADVDPTLVILNPNDLGSIDRTKASTSGNYLSGIPRGDILRNVWGTPVTTSSAITAGDFLVGDMGAATLWTRETATLLIGTDGNDMTHNLLTCLLEMRATFGVQRAASFVGSIA